MTNNTLLTLLTLLTPSHTHTHTMVAVMGRIGLGKAPKKKGKELMQKSARKLISEPRNLATLLPRKQTNKQARGENTSVVWGAFLRAE